MRNSFIHLCLLASGVVASAVPSAAEASPRRVVVLDFDGPRQLADSGRAAVMGVLGEQYNIVATRNWDSARARASGRGPQQWRQASKQAGVDAVIEGWVQAEGRHHVLTIAVKDAATGQEVDTLSVRIKDRGVPTDAASKLAAELDDLLSWIDGDVTAEPSKRLPDLRMRPVIGSRDRTRSAASDDDFADEPPRRKKKPRRTARVVRADDELDDAVVDALDAEGSDDAAEDAELDPRRAKAKKPRRKGRRATAAAVALESDESDLVTLFGPDSKEAAIVTDGKTSHVPQPTPRFMISAGPYVAARGMAFTATAPSSSAPPPPSYPASMVQGFGAHASVFPMPQATHDARQHGVGFSLDIAKSVASLLTIYDKGADEYRDSTIDQTTWQLATHYRWPIEFVTIGIQASYGQTGHKIIDVPETLGFADTAFSYVGAGANLELAVTERATVGFNVRYQYLLAAGNVTDEMAYGSGKGYGLALGGDFVIPVTDQLFVRGSVDYQRFKIDFEGSGELTKQFGVWDVTDAAITGSANLGVSF
jgi:hypothetical protein